MKSQQYDFVFVYEVKNREYDSILLLCMELERLGYSVEMIETWKQVKHRDRPLKAKVAVTFALYNDEMIRFVKQYVCNAKKIVNLQWEQIFTNGDEKQGTKGDVLKNIKGTAKKCVHICWGQNNYKTLTKVMGISPDHAIITGSVTLDFLRPEFMTYYLSKRELCKKYNIPEEKTIYLFISSFSYVALPESIINSDLYQDQGFDIEKHYYVSKESQERILDWLEKELKKHPEIILVYRPHPAESTVERLGNMQKIYENFLVIGEESVKQWILVSNKIYNWWSTSIAEVYAAGKGCTILRPVPFPYDNELQIYNNATFTCDYQAFDKEYLENNEFPILPSEMEEYYYIDKNEPAYKKVCNLLEKVLAKDEYKIDGIESIGYKHSIRLYYNFKQKLKNVIFGNANIYDVFLKLYKDRPIKGGKSIKDFKKEYTYCLEMAEKNQTNELEAEQKRKKIKEILAKNL